jgi:hypothetical protein
LENAQDDCRKTIIINKIVKLIIPDYQEKLKLDEKELTDFFNANGFKFKGDFDENKKKIIAVLKNKKKQQLKEDLFKKLREKSKLTKNISIL